jgi:hypothetical protein
MNDDLAALLRLDRALDDLAQEAAGEEGEAAGEEGEAAGEEGEAAGGAGEAGGGAGEAAGPAPEAAAKARNIAEDAPTVDFGGAERSEAGVGGAGPSEVPDGEANGDRGAAAADLDTARLTRPWGEPTLELDTNGLSRLHGTTAGGVNGHGRPTGERTNPWTDGFGDEELVDELVATAVRLRDSVPTPAPDAKARGRDAFLAAVDDLARSETPGGRRRRRLIQAAVMAAALLLIAVPGALARQALPGSPLYGVREAAQSARLALTSNPVDKARQLLNQATGMRDAAIADRSERGDCVREGTAKVQEALARLQGVSGGAATVQRDRADDLLDDFRDLAEGKLPGDHAGRGSGDDHGGRGSGDHGGSGSDRSSGSGDSTSGGSGKSSGSGSSGGSGKTAGDGGGHGGSHG